MTGGRESGKKPALSRGVPSPEARNGRPPKATLEALERAALAHLARFATSEAGLRRVLMRRVARAARAGTVDPDTAAAAVEALLARYRRSGLIDDRVFAEARAASLHRNGSSARAIRAKLAQKGIAAALIEVALQGLAREAGGLAELAAAVNYARRRRLGPFADPSRREAARETRRERDLAALGRQGFSLDVARRVIDAADVAAAEALAVQAAPEK